MNTFSRRRFLMLSALAPLAAMGCRGGGFTVFGYRAGADALYDTNIRTVYVPTFNNRAFQTSPYRGLQRDITIAVIREIEKVTPYRVTSDYQKADTELLGNVVSISKNILNRNQLNQVREGEVVVVLDVVWRDLRDGRILSNPRPTPVPGRTVPNTTLDAPPAPFDPSVELPPDPRQLELPSPVRLVVTGRYIPELGETNASAQADIHKKVAIQIVNMMEKKW